MAFVATAATHGFALLVNTLPPFERRLGGSALVKAGLLPLREATAQSRCAISKNAASVTIKGVRRL